MSDSTETSKTNFLTHTANSGKVKHGIQTSGLPNFHSLPMEALKLTGREGKRVSCPCNIHLLENHSQALVISPAGNVLSQSFGKVTPSEIGPSKSLCFSAVGVVWASRPFPEHSLRTGEQEPDHSRPGIYKARVSQGGKCQKEFCCAGGMLAAHSGAEGVGESNSTWEHTSQQGR